jgi:hypothetical protein
MTGKAILVGLLVLAIVIVFACVVVTLLQWNEVDVQFPAEHVYIEAVSPKGDRIALFSIKYQPTFIGLTDVEPHSYLTLVGTQHGEVLLRETEYHGKTGDDFAELARKHAPWAVDALAASTWAD